MKVGHGIFTWDGEERRSDRYGAFTLGDKSYAGDRDQSSLDDKALRRLAGLRVRITAVVCKTRKSGHVGDLFHGIFPATPVVGERVILGVGELDLGEGWDPDVITVVLRPSDGRRHFWFDPRLLYRLHDQTVDVFVEETTDEPHAAPDLTNAQKGVVGAVASEGSLQCKGVDPAKQKIQTVPKIEKIGDGMFAVSSQAIRNGQAVDVIVDGKPLKQPRRRR